MTDTFLLYASPLLLRPEAMVPMRRGPLLKVKGKEVRIRACGLKLTDLHLQIGCPSYHGENHL